MEGCIREVAKRQIEHGMTTIISGEFEQVTYWDEFYESLSGFKVEYAKFDTSAFRPGSPIKKAIEQIGGDGRDAKTAISKIKRARSTYLDNWLFLRNCLAPEQWIHGKINIHKPTW